MTLRGHVTVRRSGAWTTPLGRLLTLAACSARFRLARTKARAPRRPSRRERGARHRGVVRPIHRAAYPAGAGARGRAMKRDA
jgi:hypothetical protein